MSRGIGRVVAAAGAVAITVALVAGCASSSSAAASKEGSTSPTKLVFAAVPSENNEDMENQYHKIIKAMEKDLGVTIEFRATTSYAAVGEGLRSGKIDLALLGPFSYVVAKNQGAKIEPLVAEIKRKGAVPSYQSYGITAAGRSDITSLKDFKGKKVCYVDPISTSGYLFPAAGLLSSGIDPQKDVQGQFAGGHDLSALAVKNGQCDAGFAFDDMVNKTLIAKGLLKPGELKVVWKSDQIPGSPVAIRSSFAASFKSKLADELVKLNVDYFVQTGDCIAGDVNCGPDGGIYGYAKVDDTFYDPIRVVCDKTKLPSCNTL